MTAVPVFLPGSTIGVMGGGQLGRMLGLAARRMGYQLHSFSPERGTPAGQVADLEVCAQYSDEEAVRTFAKSIDVLTFEFENVPVESIEWAPNTVWYGLPDAYWRFASIDCGKRLSLKPQGCRCQSLYQLKVWLS